MLETLSKHTRFGNTPKVIRNGTVAWHTKAIKILYGRGIKKLKEKLRYVLIIC
jgi:hypothetical protein